MLRRVGVRGKLLAVVAIPVLLLILTTGALVQEQISEAARAGRVQRLTDVAVQVNRVVHALQGERTATLLFWQNQSADTRDAMQQSRAVTDTATADLDKQFAGDLAQMSPAIARSIAQTRQAHGQIATARTAVDRGGYSKAQTDAFFTTVIGIDLRLPSTITPYADPSLAPELQADGHLGSLIEAASHERDVVDLALLSGSMSDVDFGLASALVAQQQDELDDYNRIASAEMGAALSKRLLAVDNSRIDLVRSQFPALLAGQKPNRASASDWRDVADQRVLAMTSVENRLVLDISTTAATQQNDKRLRGGVVGAVAVFGLVLAMLLALALSSRLAKPLRRLTIAAGEIGEKLPRMVERMQTPGEGPDLAVEPIPVETRDEIGALAEAFNTVNDVTVRVAQEQAALRASIAEMFVNVARRNQLLLGRQISALDEMEAREADPDTLQELFRLDHLATRMRRNAESLLVLAGIDSTRRMRDSMAISDVVRSAMSEIEAYDRVDLSIVDDPQMSGRYALSIAHLLAELLENATHFSNPGTRVVVATAQTGTGVDVTITDYGLGMSEEEIESANQNIAHPPIAEVVGSQRLGLFVVGRLAARMDARVTLRRGRSAGTVVTVALPTEVYADASPADLMGVGGPRGAVAGDESANGEAQVTSSIAAPRLAEVDADALAAEAALAPAAESFMAPAANGSRRGLLPRRGRAGAAAAAEPAADATQPAAVGAAVGLMDVGDVVDAAPAAQAISSAAAPPAPEALATVPAATVPATTYEPAHTGGDTTDDFAARGGSGDTVSGAGGTFVTGETAAAAEASARRRGSFFQRRPSDEPAEQSAEQPTGEPTEEPAAHAVDETAQVNDVDHHGDTLEVAEMAVAAGVPVTGEADATPAVEPDADAHALAGARRRGSFFGRRGAAPDEAPVDQQPVDQQPVDQQPVDQQPVDQQPVDQQPVDQQPVNQQPVEAVSAPVEPVTEPAQLAFDAPLEAPAVPLMPAPAIGAPEAEAHGAAAPADAEDDEAPYAPVSLATQTTLPLETRAAATRDHAEPVAAAEAVADVETARDAETDAEAPAEPEHSFAESAPVESVPVESVPEAWTPPPALIVHARYVADEVVSAPPPAAEAPVPVRRRGLFGRRPAQPEAAAVAEPVEPVVDAEVSYEPEATPDASLAPLAKRGLFGRRKPQAVAEEPTSELPTETTPVDETDETDETVATDEAIAVTALSAAEPVADVDPVADEATSPEEPAVAALSTIPLAPPPVLAAPVAEVPVAEVPVAEVPVGDAPVVETAVHGAPFAATPVTETPVVEAPVVEAPVAEVPVAEVPVGDAPVVKTAVHGAPFAATPVVEAPVVEAPVAEAPVAEVRVAEVPVGDASVGETAVHEASFAVPPVAAPPVTETPVVEAPVAEAPIAETPLVPSRFAAALVEVPVAEVPVVETPVAEPPVAEPFVADAPVVEAPVIEAPVAEAPVAQAHVAEAMPETVPSVDELPAATEPDDVAPVVDDQPKRARRGLFGRRDKAADTQVEPPAVTAHDESMAESLLAGPDESAEQQIQEHPVQQYAVDRFPVEPAPVEPVAAPAAPVTFYGAPSIDILPGRPMGTQKKGFRRDRQQQAPAAPAPVAAAPAPVAPAPPAASTAPVARPPAAVPSPFAFQDAPSAGAPVATPAEPDAAPTASVPVAPPAQPAPASMLASTALSELRSLYQPVSTAPAPVRTDDAPAALRRRDPGATQAAYAEEDATAAPSRERNASEVRGMLSGFRAGVDRARAAAGDDDASNGPTGSRPADGSPTQQ